MNNSEILAEREIKLFGNYFPFTRSELLCLRYLIRGMSAKGIAYQLNISRRTVEGRISNMRRKTASPSKGALIQLVIEKVFLPRSLGA